MLRYANTLLFSLLFLILAPSPSEAIKPSPTVELRFSYRSLSETEIRIVLTVLANVEAKKVSISIERPLGLQLIKGKEQWEGPMKRGERKKIEITILQGMSASYEILGKASIHPVNGGIFRQESRLTLGQLHPKSLNHRPPITHKSPRGNILEFRE